MCGEISSASFTIFQHGITGTFHGPTVAIAAINQRQDHEHVFLFDRILRLELFQTLSGIFGNQSILAPLHGLGSKPADVFAAHVAQRVSTGKRLGAHAKHAHDEEVVNGAH